MARSVRCLSHCQAAARPPRGGSARSQRNLLDLAIWSIMARAARRLRSVHDLLRPLRSRASNRRLEADHERIGRCRSAVLSRPSLAASRSAWISTSTCRVSDLTAASTKHDCSPSSISFPASNDRREETRKMVRPTTGDLSRPSAATFSSGEVQVISLTGDRRPHRLGFAPARGHRMRPALSLRCGHG